MGHLQNDAGLGNLTVPHWGLPAARELLLNEVRHYSSSPAVATVAPGSSGRGSLLLGPLPLGSTVFDGIFSDKAVKDASGDQVCNHGCINLTSADAVAWTAGHKQLMRDAQSALGGGFNMRKMASTCAPNMRPGSACAARRASRAPSWPPRASGRSARRRAPPRRPLLPPRSPASHRQPQGRRRQRVDLWVLRLACSASLAPAQQNRH